MFSVSNCSTQTCFVRGVQKTPGDQTIRRCSQIRGLFPLSNQNPADIATRDISMTDMVNSDLWWRGPKFLELPEANWPPEFKPPERSESSEVNNELKKLFSGDVNTIMSADKNPKDKLSCLDPANYSVGKVYKGLSCSEKPTRRSLPTNSN